MGPQTSPRADDALAIEQLLVTKTEVPTVLIGREDDGAQNIAVEGAWVVPVLILPTVLGERARDDVDRLHAVEANKGVLDTANPGLHREGVLH